MRFTIRHTTHYTYERSGACRRPAAAPDAAADDNRADHPFLGDRGRRHRQGGVLRRRLRQPRASASRIAGLRGADHHRRRRGGDDRHRRRASATSAKWRIPQVFLRATPLTEPSDAIDAMAAALPAGKVARAAASSPGGDRHARRATSPIRPTPRPAPRRPSRAGQGRLPGPRAHLHRGGARHAACRPATSPAICMSPRSDDGGRPPRLGGGLCAGSRLGRLRPRQPHLPDGPLRAACLRLRCGIPRRRSSARGRGGGRESLRVDVVVQEQTAAAIAASWRPTSRGSESNDLLRRAAARPGHRLRRPIHAPMPASTTSRRSPRCMSGRRRATASSC